MSEESTPQPDLTEQFRELGNNLKNIIQTAWQSEEAQKLHQDIRDGFNELGKAANEAMAEFNASEAGQRIKEEAQELKERVQSGEVEAKAREEISKVLNALNTEIEKAINQISESDQAESDQDASDG